MKPTSRPIPRRLPLQMFTLGALSLFSAPSAWAQARPPSGARRIVLGQSVPLTGAADQIGAAYSSGAKLFFSSFNERKNNPGYTFEQRILDDGYDAARAVANTKQLMADKVDALFGYVGTASSDAAAAAAKGSEMVFFAPYAGSDALRAREQTHVFHVRPSLSDEALRIVRHCQTLSQTRIAVLSEDDAMGRAGLAAVTQALAEAKMQPLVASAAVPVNSDKVQAAVASIMKAQPQVVIQVALFNTTAAFIRQMRKAGYAGAFMNFSVVGLDPLFAALGKEIAGVVVSQVVPSPRSVTIPIVKEYLAAIETSDQTASYESLEGFIAAKTFAEAVRRAGKGFDSASLQKTLASMTDYDVGGFRVNLRAGVRDAVRTIDLVTVTADGRVLR
jgi:branched-chain amino acid transport system substrate-binding protein